MAKKKVKKSSVKKKAVAKKVKSPAKKSKPAKKVSRAVKPVAKKAPVQSAPKAEQLIKRDMTFEEVLTRYPETGMIMANFGLHCIGCHIAAWETVEEGARAHGLSEEDIDRMLEQMNEVARKSK